MRVSHFAMEVADHESTRRGRHSRMTPPMYTRIYDDHHCILLGFDMPVLPYLSPSCDF